MGLGIICVGQGKQSKTMFAELLKICPELKPQLDYYQKQFGYKLYPLIDLSDTELYANKNAQPLIVLHSCLQWQALHKYLAVEVKAVSGYSLGELTAYAVAKAFSLDKLIKLAITRANIMDNVTIGIKSGLTAFSGIDLIAVRNQATVYSCYIAIENSREQIIIGGNLDNLCQLEQVIAEQYPSIKQTRLKVQVASHTPIMANAEQQFYNVLDILEWNGLEYPIIASITGEVVYTKAIAITTLSQQLSHTVKFQQLMTIMSELGVDVVLELGSGNSLSRAINQLNLPLKARSISEFATLEGVATWVNAIEKHNYITNIEQHVT